MAELKIEVSSKALEKGIDLAKDFLGKLVNPGLEETGLLLKDQVAYWRFKNQIRVLNKAKEYCQQQNIDPKTISLKLLAPLLEHAGLEEDETLQDRWAYLLGNMVDSEQNIDNHVFPYLLSQLSVNEFMVLETVMKKKDDRVEKITKELVEFRAERPIIENKINKKISRLRQEIAAKRENSGDDKNYYSTYELEMEKYEMEKTLRKLPAKEIALIKKIEEAEYVPSGSLKEYQFSNLIRLGVVKVRLLPYNKGQTLEIPNDPNKDYLTVSFEVEIESDLEELYLTELGELFIRACNIRKSN